MQLERKVKVPVAPLKQNGYVLFTKIKIVMYIIVPYSLRMSLLPLFPSVWMYGSYSPEMNALIQLIRLWGLSPRQPVKARAGEPAHPGSLTRAFAVRTHEIWK